MSADDKERNSLSLFNALGTMIGSAVLAVAAPILVAEGTLQNYYVLIFGSMAMVLVLSIAGALCVKERVAFIHSGNCYSFCGINLSGHCF